ncbi:MAG: phospholipid carrier-dependent glycosyltransferase [Cyanobacteriota/Melainabacteria group bacterium]
MPSQDEAGHILSNLKYRELFLEARPWRGYWWKNLVEVNGFYPPFVYCVTGGLKSLFGPDRFLDNLGISVFVGILSTSSFLTLRVLGFGIAASVLAPVIINIYPSVAALGHSYMLDYPLLAMVSAGIFAICNWRTRRTLSWALGAGIILAMACLTKQIAVVYLVGVGGIFVLEAIFSSDKRFKKEALIQLGIMALTTALIALPYVLYSYRETAALTEAVKTSLHNEGIYNSFADYLLFYCRDGFRWMMSPLLMVLFVVSLFATGLSGHKKLLPVWVSAVVGTLLMCTNKDFPVSTRYIVPALMLPACLTAAWLGSLLECKKVVARGAAVVLLLLAVTQYISYSFCPRPLSGFSGLNGLSEAMGVGEPDMAVSDISHWAPLPKEEWGYNWALDEIERRDGNVPVYLNVLANSYSLNAHTFELVAKERKSYIQPTTSRYHTVTGDKIDFNPESALYFQWYLITSGSQGFELLDEDSRLNGKRLQKFLDDSGHFSLESKMRCPDGSELKLYRQVSSQPQPK